MRFFLFLILQFSLIAASAQSANVPEFKVTTNKSQIFRSKPNLQDRLNGVKEVQVYIPKTQTELEDYIYNNFCTYLQSLGLKVEKVYASYKTQDLHLETINGFAQLCEDEISDHLSLHNTLSAIINYTYLVGMYSSRITLKIAFVDYMNDYVWHIPDITVPNSGEKLQKKFSSTITKSYCYNPNYAFCPEMKYSNWNTNILKAYLSDNYESPLEGIYKGDDYTIGVKKDNEKYFLIYLNGADNKEEWHEGDIKAELTNTASPSIFKVDWYGKWKQKMNGTLIFSNSGFTLKTKGNTIENYIKIFPNTETVTKINKNNTVSSGTGFFIAKDGYIITNYHCIEKAKSITISGVNGDTKTKYKAIIKEIDKQNDLAILKINDFKFKGLTTIPYTLKFTTANVGEDCFVLGYPLINTMGTDIKLTNGIISAKTGYEGNTSQYQISAPVQPGNSGGPVFDKRGNIIGIVQAKHTLAENAGYAIKSSYIRNLIELLDTPIKLPQTNIMAGKSLPQQVGLARQAICIVITTE